MNDAQSATLPADQRRKVLDRVLAALQKRFYEPEKLNSDWQAAVQLTEGLSLLDKDDPVKYDFALFGLGVMENF